MSFPIPPPRPKRAQKPALTISPVTTRPNSSSGAVPASSQAAGVPSYADQGDGERTERAPRGSLVRPETSVDSESMRIHQIQKVLAGLDITQDTPPNSAGAPRPTLYLGTDGPTMSNVSSFRSPATTGSSTEDSVGRPASSSSSLGIPDSAASQPSRSPSRLDDDISKIVPGDLRDLTRLGEGSAGEVYKVLHVPSGLYMAKKTMATSPQPEIHRQILREIAFNRECRAPFIVKYYGAYLEPSEHQIVICMEFCQGGSLDSIYKQIRARGGRTGEKILGKVAEAVLNGLVYLHDRKIIHRDIKPSNILVSKEGQIKLCDFGVSGELINSMAKTFVGTSYYMAPERIQGAPYKWTSDIWSLGLTLYEVAMNRFPFPPEGEPPLGPIDLLTYIIRMEPPQLKDDENAGITYKKPIRDFLRLCLIKDATERPTPADLRSHPWIVKSASREVDMARWLRQIWGWPEEGPPL